MEKELEEDFFHDARGPYNYCTVPGERWNCSKIYLFEGRGYIRDSISFTGDKLYLKCRKSHRKHQPCKGRAIVVGVYFCIFPLCYILYVYSNIKIGIIIWETPRHLLSTLKNDKCYKYTRNSVSWVLEILKYSE